MPQRNGEICELYRARATMAALDVMAEAFNISLGRLTMTSRQKANVAFARQIAMYLCHVVGQLTLREIALEFDREPSTVLHACQAVEDQRDKSLFDKQMTVLEEALHERLEVIRRDLGALGGRPGGQTGGRPGGQTGGQTPDDQGPKSPQDGAVKTGPLEKKAVDLDGFRRRLAVG